MTNIIQQIEGRAVPLRGSDIDTDQIIESRYLKLISFQGIETHLFESVRRQWQTTKHMPHPLDDPRFDKARILIVNRNFGCGSSREHAPQAIQRFGIQAIIGESFGEIFAGNCLSIGLPCVSISANEITRLQEQCETNPQVRLMIDIEQKLIFVEGRKIAFDLPDGRRARLLDGSWDSLNVLLRHQDKLSAYFSESHPPEPRVVV